MSGLQTSVSVIVCTLQYVKLEIVKEPRVGRRIRCAPCHQLYVIVLGQNMNKRTYGLEERDDALCMVVWERRGTEDGAEETF
jgi:hypothetical protein